MSACARQQQQSAAAASEAPLIVVSDAANVRHTHEYDGAVYYHVADPYPGSVTIDNITRAMEGTPEWHPSQEHPLSSTFTDTRSWWSYYETSGALVYQWTGAWRNPRGDMVTYVLQYEAADPNAVARIMKVSAIYTTAATVDRLRKLRYR
jgi:hypothetical protein